MRFVFNSTRWWTQFYENWLNTKYDIFFHTSTNLTTSLNCSSEQPSYRSFSNSYLVILLTSTIFFRFSTGLKVSLLLLKACSASWHNVCLKHVNEFLEMPQCVGKLDAPDWNTKHTYMVFTIEMYTQSFSFIFTKYLMKHYCTPTFSVIDQIFFEMTKKI